MYVNPRDGRLEQRDTRGPHKGSSWAGCDGFEGVWVPEFLSSQVRPLICIR